MPFTSSSIFHLIFHSDLSSFLHVFGVTLWIFFFMEYSYQISLPINLMEYLFLCRWSACEFTNALDFFLILFFFADNFHFIFVSPTHWLLNLLFVRGYSISDNLSQKLIISPLVTFSYHNFRVSIGLMIQNHLFVSMYLQIKSVPF